MKTKQPSSGRRQPTPSVSPGNTTSSGARSQETTTSGTTGTKHTKAPHNAPGFVYIAANPAWPGVCKIGFARDLKNRLRSLNTGDPYRAFTFYETKEFANRAKAEATLHRLVAGFKLAPVGEWYALHPEDAAGLLRGLHKRTTLRSRQRSDAGEPDQQIRHQPD
ncbi:hypothetical protein GOC06_11235 [Sinorhizobium meliloti]|nr:hypothetical protein [Sinorhizobium meliloti]MDX1046893.1 hypothetical protein [Sinorhizobium medicae]MDX0139275.1 hypothetical protein [Sinorhizobium meliloti]MDX0194047.1 hypothetical protein [Sinorhizobium meliloti]MDX0382614.1 hypothetical protein [Sinorhizobium meliloti]